MKYLKWCFGNKAQKSSPNSESSAHAVGGAIGGEESPPEHQTAPSSSSEIEAENGKNGGNDEYALPPPDTASFGEGEIMRSAMEVPPGDDVCPICFDNFEVPCLAPCGHWYCGSCILQYWNFNDALRPCKCPMCSQQITKLTPEGSLYQRREVEISKVLQNVDSYNRLFVGGFTGVLLKLRSLPSLCIKRMFHAMMDIDRPGAFMNELRLIALLIGILYSYSPFDFLGLGQRVSRVFDYAAIALSFVLHLVGLFLHWRRLRNVRELADIPAHHE